MPSNPTLPEDVLRKALDAANLVYRGTPWGIDASDKALRAAAPLIIEWATEQAAQVAERMGARWAHSSVSYRTMREISEAIRAQFTPETKGAPDDHQ